MKAIPTKDLITFLENTTLDIIFEDDMQELFNELGDEWFFDRTIDKFDCAHSNPHRKQRLDRLKGK